jgi:hypothetical protein
LHKAKRSGTNPLTYLARHPQQDQSTEPTTPTNPDNEPF